MLRRGNPIRDLGGEFVGGHSGVGHAHDGEHTSLAAGGDFAFE